MAAVHLPPAQFGAGMLPPASKRRCAYAVSPPFLLLTSRECSGPRGIVFTFCCIVQVFGSGLFPGYEDNELVKQVEANYATAVERESAGKLTEALSNKAQVRVQLVLVL